MIKPQTTVTTSYAKGTQSYIQTVKRDRLPEKAVAYHAGHFEQ